LSPGDDIFHGEEAIFTLKDGSSHEEEAMTVLEDA